MAVGGFVLGSLILYLKGMRKMMFQLSGFYYRFFGVKVPRGSIYTTIMELAPKRPSPLWLASTIGFRGLRVGF